MLSLIAYAYTLAFRLPPVFLALATVVYAAAGRVLILLVAIVLATPLAAVLRVLLAAILLIIVLPTATALMLVLSALMLAALLLVHVFLLKNPHRANVSAIRRLRNFLGLPDVCACPTIGWRKEGNCSAPVGGVGRCGMSGSRISAWSDQIYELRSGTGIGVFAPQYGPRRGHSGKIRSQPL